MSNQKAPKMRQVVVRMPPTYHDGIKELAAQNRVSVSELVRLALSDWGERYDRREVGHWVWDPK